MRTGPPAGGAKSPKPNNKPGPQPAVNGAPRREVQEPSVQSNKAVSYTSVNSSIDLSKPGAELSLQRPFGYQDIDDFYNYTKSFSQSAELPGDPFYDFLVKGDSVVEQDIDFAKLEEGYSQYLERVFKRWVNYFRKLVKVNLEGDSNFAKEFPEHMKIHKLLAEKYKEPLSAVGVKRLLGDNPQLRKFAAITYQNQRELARDEDESRFLEFTKTYYGGKEFNITRRVYLNPKIAGLPKVVKRIFRRCQHDKDNIDCSFKVMDYTYNPGAPYSRVEDQGRRRDKIVMYTDEKNLPKLVAMLKELTTSEGFKEFFEGQPLPSMTCKVSDAIGIAQETTKEQDILLGGEGKKPLSFNQVRAIFLRALWTAFLRNQVLENGTKELKGGKTLKEVFDDSLKTTFESRNLPGEKYLKIFYEAGLDPEKLLFDDPDGLFVFQEMVRERATKGMVKALFTILPELDIEPDKAALMQLAKDSAQKCGIREDNLAFLQQS